MARLTFHGAAEGVTGSAYLLETEASRILLDCGMFQGSRKEEQANHEPLPFDPQSLDCVVISHAHLDHSGRLPLLVKAGYEGQIYATEASCDLLDILLKDAASLQERDAEWENRRRRRAGKDEVEALYTIEDVYRVLIQLEGLKYDKARQITEDVAVRLFDAGHILGSSIVELTITERGKTKVLVFSGDLGNSYTALLRAPRTLEKADIVLLESTYGDREHRSIDDTLQEFEDIVLEASKNGGNILIPSFAVGRTQELIFRLGQLYQKGLLKQQAIYLDSPMAIAVTEVYHRYQNVYNPADNAEIKQSGHHNLHSFLPSLRYSTTTEESMALNQIVSGAIIIAGSGMCNGGRIRHHLKHNLWRKQSHVIIVGYQSIGTPGRALVDGVEHFKVAGEEVVVRASIHTLGGFSAHASQSQLYEWLDHFKASKPSVYLIHGESGAKTSLQHFLKEKGWSAKIPSLGEQITF